MQFKKGDIICSDRFRYGLLLFVEDNEKNHMVDDREFYSCTSLLNPKQTWCAYEEYNWRIATDEDTARELASRIKSSEIISSDLTLDVNDDNIILNDGYENFIILTPQEAVKLRDVINNYIEG